MRGTATYTHTHKKKSKNRETPLGFVMGLLPTACSLRAIPGAAASRKCPPKPREEHKKQGQSSGGARPRLPFPPQLAVPAAAQWPFVSQPISGVPRILLPLTSRK